MSGDGRSAAVRLVMRQFLAGAASVLLTAWSVSCGAAPASRPVARSGPPAAAPELVLQTGHADRIQSVAWSPDQSLVASLGSDGKVLVWDAARALVLRELPPQTGGATVLAWAPDGTLAAGHGDGVVTLWEARSGHLKRRVEVQKLPIAYACWSPDGTVLACGGWTNEVHLWSSRTAESRSLPLPNNGENSAAWSPDGRILATGSAGGTLHLWDPSTGKLQKELKAHDGYVSVLSWSRDSRRLATGSWDGAVHIWDSDGSPGARFSLGQQVVTLAWSGDLLAVQGASRSVSLRDPATGKEVGSLPEQGGRVQTLATSPKGDRLAVGTSEGTVRIWDTRARQPLASLEGSGHAIFAAAWDPEDRLVASGGWFGATRLWDAATGEAVLSPAGRMSMVQCAAWSRDGSTLALGGVGVIREGGGARTVQLSLWDRRAHRTLRELSVSRAPWLTSVGFSPDGRMLAVGDLTGGVFILDPTSGEVRQALSGHKDEVRAVRWSPDGKRLVTVSSDSSSRVWDPSTGQMLRELKPGDSRMRAACWSPDGKQIATGDLYGSIRIWDAATYELVREIKSPGIWVDALEYSPDGHTLAAGAADGVLRLWDVSSGAEKLELRGHSGPISSLSWGRGGDRLVSASWDGALRVWVPVRGTSVALVPLRHAGSDADWIAVAPQGYYDGSEAGAQRVMWRVGGELFPAARYEARFHRPGVVRTLLARGAVTPAPLAGGDIPPGVQVVSPRPGTESRDPFVEVELFAADDRAVTDAELFVNGRPLAPADAKPLVVGARGAVGYGPAAPDGSRPIMLGAKPLMLGAKPLMMGARSLSDRHKVGRTFRFRVPMPPGAETVSVRAVVYDDQGFNSEPTDIVIRRSGAPDVKGTLHALCVGVSRYAHPEYNLKFARQDADAMAALLEGQKKLYQSVKVTRLLDADATSARIRQALTQIRKESRPSDTVILFLSGHGVEDPAGRYYFASHEVDPKALATTSVTVGQLQDLLGGTLRARSVFVFADTCHSGRIPARTGSNSRLEALKTVVLASSQGGEFSYEREEWGHGAFTLSLLEGLGGKAEPGADVVHFDALALYVRRRVQELVGQAQQVTMSANGMPLGTPVAQN